MKRATPASDILLAQHAAKCSQVPRDPDIKLAVPDADPEPKGTDIILAYLRDRYRPAFRAGNSIHTSEGEDVPMSTAVAVPTSALIEQLALALDAPRYADGRPKRESLPTFFRKWAPVAWGDLLASLPDEDGADLGATTATAEVFRRLIRDVMLAGITLGDVIGHTNATQVERRSLLGWCGKFAKPGPWASIRDYACWCQRRDNGDGELRLRVAIRHELFAQLKADRRLIEMTATKWARRAARYGVGSSTENDRPHGRKAVVLEPDFLNELTAGAPMDDLEDFAPNPKGASDSEGGGKDFEEADYPNHL